MRVEVKPEVFRKHLLAAGLRESEIREVESEMSKNNFEIGDEALLDKLLSFGIDMFRLIALFGKLGIGENTVVRMMERREREKLGAITDVYNIEVEDA